MSSFESHFGFCKLSLYNFAILQNRIARNNDSVRFVLKSLKLSFHGFLYSHKAKMQLGRRLAWNLQFCKNWLLDRMALSDSRSSL